MTRAAQILLCILLALPAAACGNKGKLKSPDQIEREAAKKAEKEKTPSPAAAPAAKSIPSGQ